MSPTVNPVEVRSFPPLFQTGDFTLRSGKKSGWKIECDGLTPKDWEALALMASEVIGPFNDVHGVKRGGVPFANALRRYATGRAAHPILIAEDVVTTGGSMERFRAELVATMLRQGNGSPVMRRFKGVTVFARGRCPEWVTPLFQMTLPPPATDDELLEDAGWTVHCRSPFQISHADGSTATGRAAEHVLAALKAGGE